VALLILKAPDRYQVRFAVQRDSEGKPKQPLVVCSLDESVWLGEDEVVDHIMRRHFNTFYQTEKVAIEPPKGTYTFVAKCGLSGMILGPPNYHDYQTKLHRLHSERFSHMPFDVYKSKVRIVREEAVVKQWLEEQSWRLEYIGLNVPEAVRLPSREEVEQHFRSVHLPNIVRQVDEFVLLPGAKRPFMSRGLNLLLRRAIEDQRRFPLRMATRLSQQFAARGLQFFKVDRAVHVCVARPHYLDLQDTVVSENIRRIVEFINAHPRTTRRQLVEALAPSPPRPTPPPSDAAVSPAQPSPEKTGDTAPPEAQASPTVTEPPQPTPEQTAIIADLHWLIHQGHIIEFHDGHIEAARQPKPRPMPAPKAEPKDAPAAAPSQPAEHATSPGDKAQSPVTPAEAVGSPPAPEPLAADAPPPSDAPAPAASAPPAPPDEAVPETQPPPPTPTVPSDACVETVPEGTPALRAAETTANTQEKGAAQPPEPSQT